MLFPYDPPQMASFWMKSVRFPLDLIFIGPEGAIAQIEADVPPCELEEGSACLSYLSREAVGYVLEINGGLSQEWGIQVGDQVRGLP